MDRDSGVLKLLRQESVDPPAGQSDSAGDAAEREALAAFEKKHSEKSYSGNGA